MISVVNSSSYDLSVVEGDDIYITSNMEQFYDDEQIRRPILSSSYKFGTSLWFNKMNSKLYNISQEAFTFMRSGLTIIFDFEWLRIPKDIEYENLSKLFWKFDEKLTMFMNGYTFNIRDEARQLLEEYIIQADLSMIPPSITLKDQSHMSYYRSVFFNTSDIKSEGIDKVLLPRIKPYSIWLATGIALNKKSGSSIAQPIYLPNNTGLFVLGNCPKQVNIDEHALLTYGINNYLGKDLTNVMLRIRTSSDFELFEESKPEHVVSSIDKNYTLTIPLLKSFGVETRHMVFVPKRTGIIQIIIEVESEFGGDYEILTIFVNESSIERKQLSVHLFDLINEKKIYSPIVEKITPTSTLCSVQFYVSATAFNYLIKRYTIETNTLVGIDSAIVCLYRLLGLRHYLREIMQTELPIFDMAADNIGKAYQTLQLYNNNDGSYSFISDKGTQYSSLYLTSLAFGAMISLMMPFRDNVTLNRTLNWILSHQAEDGSFNDNDPFFHHYGFYSGKFNRESLTAIVLYSLTHDFSLNSMPEFIHRRLCYGPKNVIMRAPHYLEKHISNVKAHLLTALCQIAIIQNFDLEIDLRKKMSHSVINTKLKNVQYDSKYVQCNEKMTFVEELLLNKMIMLLYFHLGDYKTGKNIATWIFNQIPAEKNYYKILDAVFGTQVYLQLNRYIGKNC
ncbi:unnamed protein product [Rotaria sp. Silwood1]|nr:unnamed protein product [Rotaria sp. Silwood1]CAF5083799.1 unnamed protein product [Rotaria sp. Silwood1]